jgi:hypothetical protein
VNKVGILCGVFYLRRPMGATEKQKPAFEAFRGAPVGRFGTLAACIQQHSSGAVIAILRFIQDEKLDSRRGGVSAGLIPPASSALCLTFYRNIRTPGVSCGRATRRPGFFSSESTYNALLEAGAMVFAARLSTEIAQVPLESALSHARLLPRKIKSRVIARLSSIWR